MLRCKHVAKALSDERYWNLPLYKRVGLRLHTFFCFFCGRYHNQVIDAQVCVDKYLMNEDALPPDESCCLSKDAKDKICKCMREGLDPTQCAPEDPGSCKNPETGES